MRRRPIRRFSQTLYSNQPFGAGAGPQVALAGKSRSNDLSAFTRKRFLQKAEIWPKMLVAAPLPSLVGLPLIQPYLAAPSLLSETELEGVQRAGAPTPQLLHSILFEPQLHELLREYTRKLPVCGIAPLLADLPAFECLQQQLDDLFRQFFAAARSLGDFQMQRHLAAFAREEVALAPAGLLPETEADRIGRDLRLYRQRNLEYFDDFAAQYVTHNLDANPVGEARDLWSRLLSPFTRSFAQRADLDAQARRLLAQTKGHVRSIEYCHRFELPADFFITCFNTFFHVWALCARLAQFDQSPSALYLRARLVLHTDRDIEDELRPLHIRSKGLLAHEARRHFENLRAVLSRHFTAAGLAAQPRRQLDAFVWSLLLKESVHRYHDTVFALSEYLICVWRAVHALSFEEIISGRVPFNVFAPAPDYKSRLLLINPPLEPAEFAEEQSSKQMPKRYHYQPSPPLAAEHEKAFAGRGIAQTRWFRLARKRAARESAEQRLMAGYDFFVPTLKPRRDEALLSAWRPVSSTLAAVWRARGPKTLGVHAVQP